MTINLGNQVSLSSSSSTFYLNEGPRSGWFAWNSSNLSAQVTSDPGQGIYAASFTDPTGAHGAWVRQYSGPVDLVWWGVIADGITTDPWGLAGTGPVIVSGTDNSLALHNWSIWAQAQSAAGIAVHVSLSGGGQINCDFSKNNCAYIFVNIKRLTIDWNGTRFQNTYNASVSGQNFALVMPYPMAALGYLTTDYSTPAGYFIQSTNIGDSSFTVINSGDIATSGVAAGDWIMLAALDTQFSGWPINPYLFQFVQIAKISGSVISTVQQITEKFLSTYPDWNLQSQNCGKARFWVLSKLTAWDIIHTYNDAVVCMPPGGFNHSPGLAQPYTTISGRSITLNRWVGPGLSESVAGSVTCNDCRFLTLPETDKCIDQITYNNCSSLYGIGCQSSSLNKFNVIGGSYGSVFPAGHEFYAVGVTIENLNYAGAQYGYAPNITFQSCIIKSMPFPSVVDGSTAVTVDGTNVTYSNGRFTINSSLGYSIVAWNTIPGMMVAWQATASDTSADVFPGALGTGVVLSISEDSTHYYIDTDLGSSIPSYCPTSSLRFYHVGKVSFINCSGCDAVRQASEACAAGQLYFNQQRYTFTGQSNQTGTFYGRGHLVSVAANIPPTRGGNVPGATLTLGFANTCDDTSFVSDGYTATSIVINIGVPGNRLFTQSALNGITAGDSVKVNGTTVTTGLPSNRLVEGQIFYSFSNVIPNNYQSPLVELLMTYDTGIVRKQLTSGFDPTGSNVILPTLGLLP